MSAELEEGGLWRQNFHHLCVSDSSLPCTTRETRARPAYQDHARASVSTDSMRQFRPSRGLVKVTYKAVRVSDKDTMAARRHRNLFLGKCAFHFVVVDCLGSPAKHAQRSPSS